MDSILTLNIPDLVLANQYAKYYKFIENRYDSEGYLKSKSFKVSDFFTT